MATMDDTRPRPQAPGATDAPSTPDEKPRRPKRKTVSLNLKITPRESDMIEELAGRMGTTKTDIVLTGAHLLASLFQEEQFRAKVRWMQQHAHASRQGDE